MHLQVSAQAANMQVKLTTLTLKTIYQQIHSGLARQLALQS